MANVKYNGALIQTGGSLVVDAIVDCTGSCGTAGQILSSTGAAIQWVAAGSGSGTVTSITAGTGLSGGTITTSGTISLNTSCVIQPSILTAKGSLITASGASTPVALPVGANGQILTACSTCSSGLTWAALPTNYWTCSAGTVSLCSPAELQVGASSSVGNALRSTQGKWIAKNALGETVLELEPELYSMNIRTGASLDPSPGYISILEAGQVTVSETSDSTMATNNGTGQLGAGYLTFTDADSLHKATITAQDGAANPAPLSLAISELQLNGDAGTSGYVLTSNGIGSAPTWQAAAGGGGTVTSITAGTGLSGGTITGSGTISLDTACVIQPTALTAKGSLISASAASTPSALSVGTNGQVLTADSTCTTGLKWATITQCTGTVTSVTAGTGLSGGTITGTGTLTLNTACVVQPTAYTAKGVLLTATAANTPTALSVGLNGQFLVSDSACTTGLKWCTMGLANSTSQGFVYGFPGGFNCTNASYGYQSNNTGGNCGSCNTAIGTCALLANVSGSGNTVVGYNSGKALSTTSNNTFVGASTAPAHTGTGLVAIGRNAGLALITGGNSVVIGNEAASVGTDLNFWNVIIGTQAGLNQSAGGRNTLIGAQGGCAITTGTNNIMVGMLAGSTLTTGCDNIQIGGLGNGGGQQLPVYVLGPADSNRVIMGHSLVTNAYVRVAWTITSDARDKIVDGTVPHGLEFVKQLNPVAYHFRKDRSSAIPHGPKRYGFLAQDILALEGNDSVIIDSEDSEELRYNGEALVPVLVNAIKELEARVAALEGN